MDWRKLQWSNCQRALSEEEIRRVEEALGVRFPTDYRDCVQHCHGGKPHPNMFWFDDPDIGNMGSSLGVLLSFNPDDSENILDTYRRLSPFLPPSIIPFADDGGGDFMCFNFHQPGPSSVAYWHHGEEDVVPLSDSFSSFLDLLRD